MFLFFNGFDSLCSRPSIAVVCLMIPSVTIVLDYHVPWTYEVLYCKKTFQIDASFKEGKFRILTNSFITPFLIILTMLSHVSICMYIYIYIHIIYVCVYILYIALILWLLTLFRIRQNFEPRSVWVVLQTQIDASLLYLAFSRITTIVACYSKRTLLAYDDDSVVEIAISKPRLRL